jgi:hypothetical protein
MARSRRLSSSETDTASLRFLLYDDRAMAKCTMRPRLGPDLDDAAFPAMKGFSRVPSSPCPLGAALLSDGPYLQLVSLHEERGIFLLTARRKVVLP